MEYNFDKYNWEKIQSLGMEYDYGSVMHYGAFAFSKGSGPTIMPILSGVTIGQRKAMSETDILKVNLLYECTTKITNSTLYGVIEV